MEDNNNPTNVEPRINLNEKTLPFSHISSIIKFFSRIISEEFLSKDERTF